MTNYDCVFHRRVARTKWRESRMNLSHFAHARYGFRMIDRFLYWGDHHFPKSGKIKGSCQPPLVKSFLPTFKATGTFNLCGYSVD